MLVRMRAPLPALRGLDAACSRAAVVSRMPAGPVARAAACRTARVWVPTSEAPPVSQPSKAAATASSAVGEVRSAPVAATRAMQMDIWVSSLHSPGARSPRPPPIISGSPAGGVANS